MTERNFRLIEGEGLPPVDVARDRIREVVESVTDTLVSIRDGEVPLSGCLADAVHRTLGEAVDLLSLWASPDWWWDEVS